MDALSGTRELGQLGAGETGFIEIAMSATTWGEGAENNLVARLGDPNQVQGTFNLSPSVAQVLLPAGGCSCWVEWRSCLGGADVNICVTKRLFCIKCSKTFGRFVHFVPPQMRGLYISFGVTGDGAVDHGRSSPRE